MKRPIRIKDVSVGDAQTMFLQHCKSKNLADATIRDYTTFTKHIVDYMGYDSPMELLTGYAGRTGAPERI